LFSRAWDIPQVKIAWNELILEFGEL
jgi:hypothetical protein